MAKAIPSLATEEKRWAAENDARTLANADAINGDQKRQKAAQGAAKRLAKDEAKQAKEAQSRSDGMARLAMGGAKAFGKGASPKPPATKRPAAKSTKPRPARAKKK